MRNKIITTAREWIDTPYQHQAMVKHVGVDCVGLIAGVGVELGLLNLPTKEVRQFWNYGRLPDPEKMGRLLEKYLIRIDSDDQDIADIAWIQWRDGMPMHLAMMSKMKSRDTIIHAYSGVGKAVEHSLTEEWHDRINSFWRYPGLN